MTNQVCTLMFILHLLQWKDLKHLPKIDQSLSVQLTTHNQNKNLPDWFASCCFFKYIITERPAIFNTIKITQSFDHVMVCCSSEQRAGHHDWRMKAV